MPNVPKLPVRKSALLVIDVQDSFKAMPKWAERNNPAFEANITRLIASYRDAGLPVVWILHTDDDPTFRRDSPHFKLMDFVAQQDGEPLFVKNVRNALTGTDLPAWLAERSIRRLVVTGIQTEQCCETTARVAGDLGYDVDFVTDSTRTFPIRHEVEGEVVEIGADDLAWRTEMVLRGRFARIATTESIVEELAAEDATGALPSRSYSA